MTANTEKDALAPAAHERIGVFIRPTGVPQYVQQALFRALFRDAQIVHFLAVVVALFLGTFAWRHLGIAIAPYWTAAVLVLEAVVIGLVLSFEPYAQREHRRRRWAALYVGCNHAVSVLWAVAAWQFVVPELWVETMLVVVLLMAVVAGALLPFSRYFPLYLVLALCIGLTLVARMAFVAPERPVYGLLAVLLAMVLPALLRLSRATFDQHVSALMSRVPVAELGDRGDAARHPDNETEVDPLTGVSNLNAFLGTGRGHLAQQGHGSAQVLAIDLDRFDLVNRALGLGAGDYVLRTVASRLQAALSGEGLVARIAADEFAVLLPRHRGDSVGPLPSRLQRVVSRPIAWMGEELVLSASMGLAWMPDDGADLEAALQAAVSAMKAGKREHRGQIRCYSPELGELERMEKRMELELAMAERRDELFLAYQPKVRVADGRVLGAEALARWQSEALGHVPPGEFIPVAEKTGQIGRIGAWAMREACLEALSWPGEMSVAVNVSAIQFREAAFAEMVQRMLEEVGLPASRLELEVTESAILSSPERIRDNLQRLRRLGVTLALDDFGTGYSSISHLRDLPVDVVKLDRSFVSGLHEEHQKRSIVRAAVTLCRDLDITVVAEGVECREEAVLLEELGCELAQGFLWSVPLAPERFRAYAQAHL